MLILSSITLFLTKMHLQPNTFWWVVWWAMHVSSRIGRIPHAPSSPEDGETAAAARGGTTERGVSNAQAHSARLQFTELLLLMHTIKSLQFILRSSLRISTTDKGHLALCLNAINQWKWITWPKWRYTWITTSYTHTKHSHHLALQHPHSMGTKNTRRVQPQDT